MNLSEEKKIKHVAWTVGIGFLGSVVAFIISMCFPSDFSTNPPTLHPLMLVFGQIQTALYILGCTALGMKLTEEKNTLPAIGFTMMAIAQGVIFVLTTISPTPTHDTMDETYRMFAASLYLLIPSMIMIANYGDFPRWLNIMGVAACVPYIIENILFSLSKEFTQLLAMVDFSGQLLFNITAVGWGVLVLKNAKKEIKNLSLQKE